MKKEKSKDKALRAIKGLLETRNSDMEIGDRFDGYLEWANKKRILDRRGGKGDRESLLSKFLQSGEANKKQDQKKGQPFLRTGAAPLQYSLSCMTLESDTNRSVLPNNFNKFVLEPQRPPPTFTWSSTPPSVWLRETDRSASISEQQSSSSPSQAPSGSSAAPASVLGAAPSGPSPSNAALGTEWREPQTASRMDNDPEIKLRSPLTALPGEQSVSNVAGSLKAHTDFWRMLDSPPWFVRVINEGYALPFAHGMSFTSYKVENNQSVVQRKGFVTLEVRKLLASGAVSLRDVRPYVVSSLLVATNLSRLRLILDLSRLNTFLDKTTVLYERLDCLRADI